MTIRCKMKVLSIGRRMGSRNTGRKDEHGRDIWEPGEARDIEMAAVYSDKSEENKRFWQATPSGTLKFQTVNADVADSLELDKEYYIDIHPAF